MRIAYTNTPDDYVAATRCQIQHSPFRGRWNWWISIVAVLFIYLPAVFTSWQNGLRWVAWVTAAVAAVYVYETSVQPRLFLALVKWQVRRLFAKSSHPKYAEYFGERDLELEAGRIIDHSPKGYFVVNLKFVEPLMSTPDHTIVIGPTRNYIIPRREGHEAEYDRFTEALREQWAQVRG